MKLINHFNDFLKDTINLNKTRLETLESSVETIKTVIKESDWQPRVWRFVEQGSWAHETIIKPVEGGEFDADLLVVIAEVEGWDAKKYIDTLHEELSNNKIYKDKLRRWSHCVTLTYVGQRKIDIAPCIKDREDGGSLEVCNRTTNCFERTEPESYTRWINEQNKYSTKNAFRKTTRIIKYIRDITGKFNCPSIILTTLIADRIYWHDKDSATFADVPTALKTLFGRLDDFLQQHPTKPKICNPSYQAEDFSDLLTEIQYGNLRTAVADLRAKIDEAYEEEDREQSIKKWQKVLGERFAQGANVLAKAALTEDTSTFDVLLREDAHHDSKIVDFIGKIGSWLWTPDLDRPAHMSEPVWERADNVNDNLRVQAAWSTSKDAASKQPVQDFDVLESHGGLWFDVVQPDGSAIPVGYFVRWRITNTGIIAMALGKGRGEIYSPTTGHKRWEPLAYRGVHLAEAFVIKHSDNKIVAQTPPFHVVIE